jgi:hypothetical protein
MDNIINKITNIESINETKKIIFIDENINEKTNIKTIVREKKEPKMRVESQKWDLDSNYYNIFDNQIELINKIKKNNYLANDENNSKIICRQIERKISGYKHQDVLKGILDVNKLVKFQEIIDAIITADFKCYYCKINMYILYDIVRETQQWTVDRIDNDLGHNRDNFVLACLGCNLKRRCRSKEKFLFTKQLVIIKSNL